MLFRRRFLLLMLVGLSACIPKPGATAAPTAAAPPPSAAPLKATPPRTTYSQTIRFEHISITEGLSQSVVNAILQDRRGFLWIGTEDGLNRYDGYEIKVFRPEPENPESLSDRWITALGEDTQGYLWIGTRQGGLNRFDPMTGKFMNYRHEPAVPDSLGDDHVWAIYPDGAGIWVGTASSLDLLEPASGTFEHLRANPELEGRLSSDQITTILKDSRGMLWVGTLDGGANVYDPVTRSFSAYKNYPDDPASLSHNRVLSIAEDAQGSVWVGAANGLNRFDPESRTFTRLQNDAGNPDSLSGNAVLAVYTDRSGGLWVGTERGLDRYEFETGRFIHHQHHLAIANSLSHNTVRAIYEDRGGVLWIGTFSGLNKYNRQQDQFAFHQHHPDRPNSLGGNRVLAIHVDPEMQVWIGLDGNGLDLFSPANEWFSHFRHDSADPTSLGSDEVWSVLTDAQGFVWVGTSAGLDRYDPLTGDFTHFGPEPENPTSLSGAPVYALLESRDGALWVGTARGLDQFDPASRSFIHPQVEPIQEDDITGRQVTAILEDASGALWVGTFDNGLSRFERGQPTRLVHYSYEPGDPDSLSNDSVLSLALDSRGTLWIGTAGGGLNRFHRGTNSFTHYTEQDGLPNDVVYGIVEDEIGHLWLSTNLGLGRLDPALESFQNYTASDGLQSNEFSQGSHAKGPDGAIYFGGINGFNVLRPTELAINPNPPSTVLTSLTQDGTPLLEAGQEGAAREITLNWPQNSFEFTMAGLAFGQPSRNQYAYMLENFDRDWIYIEHERTGRYASLPGGEYTLLLRASNSDGLWNEVPERIAVRVIPPFWNTTWFRLLMVLTVVAVSIGTYQLRLKTIESRNRDLERLVQLRTSDLAKRTGEIEALYGADERILKNVTLSQVFQTLLDVSVEMLHADRSAIFVWDEESSILKARLSYGFRAETLAKLESPEGQRLLTHVLEQGEPVVVSDVAAADEASSLEAGLQDSLLARTDAGVRTAILAEGIRSFAHFALKTDGKVVAVFKVAYGRPNALTEDVVRLYAALVQRAVLSITNMQLFEQTKDLAVIEVRNRLARDLHDSAKQKAFAALAQLGTANAMVSRSHFEAVKTHVMEAENLVHEVIQELTFLVQEIYPLALQEKGLPTTLREYAFEWENRNEIDLKLTISEARPLPLDIEQAIYRVVQESLANIARHSHASHAEICLTYRPEALEAVITDDGVGFEAGQSNPGLGLRSMRERVGSLHGRLQIQSKLGEGTRLSVHAPLKR
jgi:ligand-binding sensor domain-containing protein/signal transduction histidine kinase